MKARAIPMVALAWLAVPAGALAGADFVIEASGAGFSDATPVPPVGGNRARTLGAQRLAAVKYAASVWSKLLDSPVPIVVKVALEELGCLDDEDRLTLASAGPADMEMFTDPSDDESVVAMPVALASRIRGEDVEPGLHDINMSINVDVDRGTCLTRTGGWYYGFDGASEGKQDLIDVLLHELAHGLGFISIRDKTSGQLLRGRDAFGRTVTVVDVFTQQIVDASSDRPFAELSDEERLRATSTPHSAVWGGPAVRAEVAKYLVAGAPKLTLSPALPGFSGLLGEGGAGARLTASGVQAPLFLLPSTQPCAAPPQVAGSIVAFQSIPPCLLAQHAEALQRAGAAGLILALPSSLGDAPFSFSEPLRGGLGIPMVTIAGRDAQLLGAAQALLPRRAHLFAASDQLAGADAKGRPYLYTNGPGVVASTLGHFDLLPRPDLLMEPFSRDRTTHGIDLTRAVLADIGWAVTCGNGRLDPGELCDEGAANSDAPEARCLTTCKPAQCGDGILSQGERCDEGVFNSDREPDACRTSCQKPRCGDGVLDQGERCDGPGCGEGCGVIPLVDAGSVSSGIARWPETMGAEGGDDDGCALASSRPSALFTALIGLGLLGLRRRRRR